MANYNSGRLYNHKIANGGTSYNSAPFVILVLESGYGLDEVKNRINSMQIFDNAISSDQIMLITDVQIADQSFSNDFLSTIANVGLSDSGTGYDKIQNIKATIPIVDTGTGNEVVNVAGAFFVIDSNNVLQPLGVIVLKDSHYELLPSTRDITDEVPGMHGEIDFGTEIKARNLELHVVTNNGLSPLEKSHLQRLIAKYLDPTKGAKTLIFSNDIEKTYNVKYSGKIDPTVYATWFEFTLPFKMSNPFIKGSFEKTLTGSGTLINNGTFETPLTIEITGPSTNPSLKIGNDTLLYTGTILSGQTLTIASNGSSGTVKLNGVNAISGYNGVFPSLQPGQTSVTANNNTTIRWRDCWL
jgi:predicted phage tail component-like protein